MPIDTNVAAPLRDDERVTASRAMMARHDGHSYHFSGIVRRASLQILSASRNKRRRYRWRLEILPCLARASREAVEEVSE